MNRLDLRTAGRSKQLRCANGLQELIVQKRRSDTKLGVPKIEHKLKIRHHRVRHTSSIENKLTAGNLTARGYNHGTLPAHQPRKQENFRFRKILKIASSIRDMVY